MELVPHNGDEWAAMLTATGREVVTELSPLMSCDAVWWAGPPPLPPRSVPGVGCTVDELTDESNRCSILSSRRRPARIGGGVEARHPGDGDGGDSVCLCADVDCPDPSPGTDTERIPVTGVATLWVRSA